MKRIIILLVLLVFSVGASAAFYGPYTLMAPVAIDGDTLRADVQIWPDTVVDVAIRVIGVDTPELHASIACERDRARLAKLFTDAWIQSHAPLMIGAVKPDKYAGRYDAVVTGNDGTSLSKALIDSGHGRPYSGGAREPWCQ